MKLHCVFCHRSLNIGRRTCPKPKLSLKGAPLDRSCKCDGATLRFVIMAFRSSLMFLFISVSMRKANFFMWILSFVSPKFNNSVSRHSLYSSFSLQKTSVPCVIRMCVFFASPIFCLTFPSLTHFATTSNQPSVVIATRTHMLSRPPLFFFLRHSLPS